MIPAWWLIGLFIVLDLGAQLFTPANGIANIAHLGGYAFGIAVAFTLLVTKILPKEQYDMFSIAKQRKRRADFRAAHEMHKRAGVFQADEKLDPVSAKIAEQRSAIGAAVSSDDLSTASKLYLEMLNEHEETTSDKNAKSMTMHRDAQYQIANHLYQSAQRQAAADAFARLLDTYPNDKERNIITILLARINANDLADPTTAIQLLEELTDKALDASTKELVDSELNTIRAMIKD